MDWKEISADYEAFKKCVSCPDNCEFWHRDDKNGRRHLLDAYAKALLMPEKDHLLYARILWSMSIAFESDTRCGTFRISSTDGFLAEAQKEYEIARKGTGAVPTERELESIEGSMRRLRQGEARRKYEIEQMQDDDWCYKKHLPRIENGELLKDFIFHDGVILKFEHLPMEHAIVVKVGETFFTKQIPGKLKVVTLRFDGVDYINYNHEDECRWLSDVWFFPAYEHPEELVFDFDGFRIYCDKITVTGMEMVDRSEIPEGFL